MNCAKSGQQNPDNAPSCSACGSALAQPAPTTEPVQVRTSRLAIGSFILAILTLLTLIIAGVEGGLILALAAVTAAILALLLGIVSLARIGTTAGRLTGNSFAVLGTALPLLLFVATPISCSMMQGLTKLAPSMTCGKNLSRLGIAMLIYAQDYDDQFPRAGGPNTTWQPTINNWKADSKQDAFAMNPDGTGGQASISSSFYLLVKHADVAPETFVCPHDRGTERFDLSRYRVREKDFTNLWDFGPDPTKHCSYTYHMPYGPYAIDTSSEGGLAVAADRNPFIDSPAAEALSISDFDPHGTMEQQKLGNSPSHKKEGQNVLYTDIHVSFEKRSYCGIDEDNIYTSWAGPDKRRGAAPTLTSQPADRTDSLLVHDPPATSDRTNK